MSTARLQRELLSNLPFYEERVDLACAFRWTARLNMHEAVANHFSLAVNDDGTRFLMNPNQVHFSRIKASDLLLIDANDPGDDEPARTRPTRRPGACTARSIATCPHARCVMHVHSIHATVLASLADSTLPPIDQNSAMFFNRQVVDGHYGGLAFEEEGERCSQLLADPKVKVMVMGNHGMLVIGDTVADAFNRMYLFRARRRDLHQGAVDRPAAAHAVRRGRREGGERDGRLSRPGRAALWPSSRRSSTSRSRPTADRRLRAGFFSLSCACGRKARAGGERCRSPALGRSRPAAARSDPI